MAEPINGTAPAVTVSTAEEHLLGATAMAQEEMKALLERFGEADVDWGYVEIELAIIAKRHKLSLPALRRAANLQREKLQVRPGLSAARAARQAQVIQLDDARDIHTFDMIVSMKDIPPLMPADAALTLMNRMFAFVHDWGGDTLIAHCQPDGSLRPLDERQFLRSLANRAVVGTINGSVPLAKWWLTHSERREVNQVIFDPEQTKLDATVINTWSGFAIAPRQACWTRIASHLFRIVCNKDRDCWRYLIRWLAHAVQRPGTAPGVVIVLRSASEGAGKSTLSEFMDIIFGRHSILLNTPEDLIGQFNDHLENICFIGLNEPSFPGDHRAAGKFKSMITDPWWLINGKYRKVRRVRNIAHVVLTTNADWAIPAGNKARRFAMLDVDESRADDLPYFATLRDEADNGGIAGMLHALLHVKVTDGELRAVPRTAALRQQQIQSASPMIRWAWDVVSSGDALASVDFRRDLERERDPEVANGFSTRVSTKDLYRRFDQWTVGDMKMRPVSREAFGRWVSSLGFPSVIIKGMRHYDIPDRQEFISAVFRKGGII